MVADNRHIMPKVSLDMPAEILTDIKRHVGDEKKFVSVADAIRTACRKLLDQLDEIDLRNGREVYANKTRCKRSRKDTA